MKDKLWPSTAPPPMPVIPENLEWIVLATFVVIWLIGGNSLFAYVSSDARPIGADTRAAAWFGTCSGVHAQRSDLVSDVMAIASHHRARVVPLRARFWLALCPVARRLTDCGRMDRHHPRLAPTAVRFSIGRSPAGWDWKVFGVAEIARGHGSI